jgi:hypothetical protein
LVHKYVDLKAKPQVLDSIAKWTSFEFYTKSRKFSDIGSTLGLCNFQSIGFLPKVTTTSL